MNIRTPSLAVMCTLLFAACGGTDDSNRVGDSAEECFTEGKVFVLVRDALGEPVDAESVTYSRDGVSGDAAHGGTGFYSFAGNEGEYEVTVTACGGVQTVSDTVNLQHDRTCTDTDSPISDVTFTIEPC